MSAVHEAAVKQAYAQLQDQATRCWDNTWHSERPVVTVGTATCGRAAGANEVLEAIRDELARTNVDAVIVEVGCMGHCYAEPIVNVAKPGYPTLIYGYVTPDVARRLVQDFLVNDDPCLEFALGALEQNDIFPSIQDLPRFEHERLMLLSNCGRIDPQDIYHYIVKGGYEGLASVLQRAPDSVIEEIKSSRLRGRGGAGYPTGQKWQECALAAGDRKYVICNADEGDPGAFMDRALLESDPQAALEGLTIAAYAVGATQGYIYLRTEYPLAVQRVKLALSQARELGLLGANILGSSFSLDVELFTGSGAFVCGEETALIASLEGRPGLPKHRPPYPSTSGLWGRPTVIDNVKTLASVPHILRHGANWFADIGTPSSTGTAVFALAGKVLNAGLVEVPMGATLRQVLFDVGGGVPKNKAFKAVQIGGPSGGCLPESALDLPVDFDSLREAGAMMGSGGLVVFDEDDCMVEVARFFLDFTQSESCGKCTMCRLGTKHMQEILERITRGQGRAEDLALLSDLAEDVKLGSLCGLGRTAPNPVLTTLRYFREEYDAHINEGRCPALMCKDLIAFYILPDKCERSCDVCVGSCTVEAIKAEKGKVRVIEQDKCVKCGVCQDVCPPQYQAIVRVSPPGEVPGGEQSHG